MQIPTITLFVIAFAARLCCIGSASVHVGGTSPNFLEISDAVDTEISDAVDTSEVTARVKNVAALAATEQYALQAQQEALIALQQEQDHLTARMDAIEAGSAAAMQVNRQELFYLCSPKTGGTCMVHNCDKERGMVVCESGSCVCQPGICADGHGRCLSHKPARELPGTYKIRREGCGSYLYMGKERVGFEKFPLEKIGKRELFKEGHWHIVVNNDNSVMLYTHEYGPRASYLSRM